LSQAAQERRQEAFQRAVAAELVDSAEHVKIDDKRGVTPVTHQGREHFCVRVSNYLEANEISDLA
jgi:hypothetical protein